MHLALGASLTGKVVSLGTTWLLMPFIAAKIGTQAFGIYSLYLSFVSVLSVVDSGFGITISKTAAELRVTGTPAQLNQLLANSVKYFRRIALLCSLLLAVSGLSMVKTNASPEAYYIISGAAICCIQLSFSPLPRFLVGIGEAYRWNLWLIFGNLSFGLAILSIYIINDVTNVWPLIASQAAAVLIPYLFAWRYVRPRTKQVSAPPSVHFKLNLGAEGAVQLLVIAAGLLQREFPKWNVLRSFSVNDLGKLGLLLILLNGIGGIVGMFTQLLWPQLSAAYAKRDLQWIATSIKLLRMLYGAYVIILAGFTIAWCFPWTYIRISGDFSYSTADKLLFSCFAGLVIWEHIHYIIMLGLGRMTTVLKICLIQASVALIGWVSMPIENDVHRYFAAQIAAYCMGALLLYPFSLTRLLKNLSNET